MDMSVGIRNATSFNMKLKADMTIRRRLLLVKKITSIVNYFLLLVLAMVIYQPLCAVASEYTTLAVKGSVTYTVNGVRKELKPGMPLSVGTLIQSGANGQAIIQLGKSFQIYQITSNTKARLMNSGIEKLSKSREKEELLSKKSQEPKLLFLSGEGNSGARKDKSLAKSLK
jgi:hypothetical protein